MEDLEQTLTDQWQAGTADMVDNVIPHPDPLSRVHVPILSASRNIHAAQDSQMWASKGTAFHHRELPCPWIILPNLKGSLPAMAGWWRDMRGLVPWPQVETFLKGHSSSQVFLGIHWSLSWKLTAGLLTIQSCLTSLQVKHPRESFSKPSGYNSPVLGSLT